MGVGRNPMKAYGLAFFFFTRLGESAFIALRNVKQNERRGARDFVRHELNLFNNNARVAPL
jgi:hypothetical protein